MRNKTMPNWVNMYGRYSVSPGRASIAVASTRTSALSQLSGRGLAPAGSAESITGIVFVPVPAGVALDPAATTSGTKK